MSKDKTLTRYVSPVDQFINKFNEEHPQLSASQIQEKEKYNRISFLRDVADRAEENKLPEDF